MVNIVSSRFRHGPKTEERAIDEADVYKRQAIAQPFQHRLCRRELGSVIEVGVNVGGGGEVAVPQIGRAHV